MMTTGEGSTTSMLATTKSSRTTAEPGSTTTKTPLTTTTTTTTTTTDEAVLQTFQRTNETVYAIWNTTAGDDSSPSSPGQKPGTYYPGEPPEAALDGNLSSEYTNHGICSASDPLKNECGIQTGFYVTFNSTPFILVKFRIATNKHSPERDPNTITIEGSNNNESDLVFGKSWNLIYDGDAGLAKVPGRRAYAEDKEKLQPWQLYLELFISSLEKLSSVNQTIYRGVKMDLSAQYPQGQIFTWWGFSSCTNSVQVLQSE
ncbi:unnamed protein product [Adineta steineri]|uniref:Uncharacterized protein n=1 Tax=Adineta steineri TaxID=433720 RepID=A0A815ML21_9BILA|nr:unnamed protein product [Adineta steineri]CAF1622578.1 unnamed protein product [Adineta steineri]